MKDLNDRRWREWCESFLTCQKKPMTKDQTILFLKLLVSEVKHPEASEALLKGLQEVKEWLIMDARCKSLGVRATVFLKLFLLALCQNPATAVMYCHAMRRMQQKKEATDMTPLAMRDLSSGPFAVGFPDDDELHRVWLLQKLGVGEREAGLSVLGTRSDNYLDFIVDMEVMGNQH